MLAVRDLRWRPSALLGRSGHEDKHNQYLHPGIYVATEGAAPNRVFDIEYDTCRYNSGACNNGRAKFVVRLFEGQDRFDYIYNAVTDQGASATIGVQKDNGSQYTAFSSNQAILTSGTRLTFTLPTWNDCHRLD